MKKKIYSIVLTIVFIFAILSFVIFSILGFEVFVDESPNGEYQIVSWWINEGGYGYGGAFYIKEKGFFSKWYKIGSVPFSNEWLSETEFSIDYSYPIDEDYYKEYNVNEFFGE